MKNEIRVRIAFVPPDDAFENVTAEQIQAALLRAFPLLRSHEIVVEALPDTAAQIQHALKAAQDECEHIGARAMRNGERAYAAACVECQMAIGDLAWVDEQGLLHTGNGLPLRCP